MRLVLVNMFELSSFLLTVPMPFFLCESFLSFMIHVLSVPCSTVTTCWERADLLALLCVKISRVFVTFQYGVPGQVRYLIVSIPYIYLPLYFVDLSLF